MPGFVKEQLKNNLWCCTSCKTLSLSLSFFKVRGNSSSSSNGFDLQAIRNTDGNDVCVDCGAPSKFVGSTLMAIPNNPLFLVNVFLIG